MAGEDVIIQEGSRRFAQRMLKAITCRGGSRIVKEIQSTVSWRFLKFMLT